MASTTRSGTAGLTEEERAFAIKGQVTEHPGHSIDHAVASDTTSRTVKADLFPDASEPSTGNKS